jgi:hypothetical protein
MWWGAYPDHLSKIRNPYVNKVLNTTSHKVKKELFANVLGELIPFPADSVKIRNLVVNKMLNPRRIRQVPLSIHPQNPRTSNI